MSARYKLCVANILMLSGVTPWIAMIVWVMAILFLNVHGKSPRVFMLDPIAMIGLMIVIFVLALLFSGTGFFWSRSLAQRHADLRAGAVVLTLRIIVGVTIGLPLLLIICSRIFDIL